MAYLLLTCSVMFAVLNSCLLHIFGNRGLRHIGDIFWFNGGISIVWSLILGIWTCIDGGFFFDRVTLAYGFAYGILLCLFLLLKMEALSLGPVGITTLIGSAAFVVPVLYTFIFKGEKLTVFQISGMLLLFAALVLCIVPKAAEEGTAREKEKNPVILWFILSFLFFCAGGGVGILYKEFGASSASGNINSMMFTASIISAVLFFAIGYLLTVIKKVPAPYIPKPSLRYLVLSGITSCIYIRLNLSLSGMIPTAVFFPVCNGAIVAFSALAGILFFKEKLNGMKITGFVLSLTAIFIIGCGDYLISLL